MTNQTNGNDQNQPNPEQDTPSKYQEALDKVRARMDGGFNEPIDRKEQSEDIIEAIKKRSRFGSSKFRNREYTPGRGIKYKIDF